MTTGRDQEAFQNSSSRDLDRLGWISEVLEFVSIHFWSLIATTIGVGVFWYVPQISNLWKQWPHHWSESLGLGVLLLLLTWIYPLTLFWLWQRTLLRAWKPAWRQAAIQFCLERRLLLIFFSVLFAPPRFLTSKLHTSALMMVRFSSGLAGLLVVLVLLFCGAALILWVPVDIHIPYLMFGGFVRMFGFWLVLVSLWLGFGKIFGADAMLQTTDYPISVIVDSEERRRRVWHAAGRVLGRTSGQSSN